MTRSIWHERRGLLTVLLLLLVANTIFFFTYRVRYEQRLAALDQRMEEVQQRMQEARRARLSAEQQIADYRRIERDLQQVYNVRWSTQEARLAPLITEVKRLAVTSELVPRTISFTQTAPRLRGPKPETGATVVGISFAVQGNYQQVRRLINLLELSEQFVIIDQISLNSESGETLTLNLRVKTLFRESPAASQDQRL